MFYYISEMYIFTNLLLLVHTTLWVANNCDLYCTYTQPNLITFKIQYFTDTFDIRKGDRHTEGNVNLGENASTSLRDDSTRLSVVDDEVASRATQIVQVFSEENMRLRKQLEKYYQEIKHLKMASFNIFNFY